MIDIRPFKLTDVDNFKYRDIYGPGMDLLLKYNQDPKVTICVGDTVLAIIGVTPMFRNMVEFWTVTAQYDVLKPYIKEYIRILRLAIQDYMEREDLKRAQIIVPSSFDTARKWGPALGFSYEGTLKNYGWDCRDYFMFARYR